jgi:hypothetical protein
MLTLKKPMTMLIFFLMMLLAVVSSGAMAEWLAVGVSNTGVAVYTRPTTVHKANNIVEMWTLDNYKSYRRSSRGSMFLSKKMQCEYDCNKRSARTLYATTHSENMGRGRTIYYITDPSEWKPVQPKSMDEALWKFACGQN